MFGEFEFTGGCVSDGWGGYFLISCSFLFSGAWRGGIGVLEWGWRCSAIKGTHSSVAVDSGGASVVYFHLVRVGNSDNCVRFMESWC